jgi:hypothetical protein
MTQQRRKGFPFQGHRQALGVGEIGLPRLTRAMLLREKDLMPLVFAMQRPPLGNMPMQRPHLPGAGSYPEIF